MTLGLTNGMWEKPPHMARPSLTLFLPAWNEEEYVERTVARAKVVLDRLSDDWEIIVVNDGSADDTVKRMIDEFRMEPIDVPYRPSLDTEAIHRVYKSRLPLPIVLVDKENGGKGDAIGFCGDRSVD